MIYSATSHQFFTRASRLFLHLQDPSYCPILQMVWAADGEQRIEMGQKDIRWRYGAFSADEGQSVG
jgi:hypothetical protein